MAQPYENNPIHGAVELLKTNGFDALAEAVTVPINSAMVAEHSGYLDLRHRCPAWRRLSGKSLPRGSRPRLLTTPCMISVIEPQGVPVVLNGL